MGSGDTANFFIPQFQNVSNILARVTGNNPSKLFGTVGVDTNLVGMPTEGYGFSNDAAGSFGPPAFEAAAVEVTEGKAAATVSVRY